MDPFSSDALALGLMRYIVFLLSTTCHEASHALAAKLGGDNTAAHGGQVTLNPLPHVLREPFGMVVVPLLSLFTGGAMIGWASAPYDPTWQARYPRRAAWMSLAGPGANFALVLISALLIHAGFAAGAFRPPDRLSSVHLIQAVQPGFMEGVAIFLSVLFSLNLLLGVFNLFPIPPLDGFSALGVAMTENGARRWFDLAHGFRQYSFIGLLVMWKVFGYIYAPIFYAGLHLLYPGLGSR